MGSFSVINPTTFLPDTTNKFFTYHHNTTDVYGNMSNIDNVIPNDIAISNINTHTTNPRLVTGVIVVLCLVFNLLGNSVVFLVYNFRVKPSVFSLYVTVLAFLDIVTALTTMWMDAIVKMRPLDESFLDLTSLCKVTHYQVYSQNLISGSVLTLIAYQRYRKICHPLEPSLKIRSAKILLVIISIVCLVVTAPMLVINGSRDVLVKVHNHVVNVTICRYDKDSEGTYLKIVFSTFILCAFSLILCLTVMFHVMVANAVKKFERRSTRISNRAPTSRDTNMIDTEQCMNANNYENIEKLQQYRVSRQSPSHSISSGGYSDRITKQMYRVFATITTIFIVSYLPHIVVLFLTMAMELDYQVLTYTQRFFLDIAYSFAYISTVANPVVYGFQNAEFREHLRYILTYRSRR